jgi:hypothetical protein
MQRNTQLYMMQNRGQAPMGAQRTPQQFPQAFTFAQIPGMTVPYMYPRSNAQQQLYNLQQRQNQPK